MKRTEFIGPYLYYSEEFVDDIRKAYEQEIEKLRKENKVTNKLKNLFKMVVIRPNNIDDKYELFGLSKQQLYTFLYLLRNELLDIKYGKKPNEIYFEEFTMVNGGKDNEK